MTTQYDPTLTNRPPPRSTSRRRLIKSALALGLYSGLADFMVAHQVAAAPGGSSLWMDQRMQDHLKRVLELSEPDWQALSPRLDRVLMLVRQRDQFGRAKTPKPPKPDRPPRDLASGGDIVSLKVDSSLDSGPGTPGAEMREHYRNLIALASDKFARTGELRDTLIRFRAARAKAAEELAKAREDLRGLVTVKQEVVLVVMGVLD